MAIQGFFMGRPPSLASQSKSNKDNIILRPMYGKLDNGYAYV